MLHRAPTPIAPDPPVSLRPGRWGLACLGLLATVLLLYVAIGWLSPGYVADMDNGKVWIRWLARNGLSNAYRIPMDYPPLALYPFALAGAIYQAIADPGFNEGAARQSQLLTLLLKMSGITFHVALAGLIYVLARQRGPRVAFLASAVYAANPAVAYDVPHLGQTDPLVAGFTVAGVGALVARRPALGGVAFALAALSKPQAWALLPIVAWALFRGLGPRASARAGLAGLATLVLVLLPWILGNRIYQLPRFFEYLSTRSTANSAISADAHNIWWIPTLLNGEWVADSQPLVGPLSYGVAGLLLGAAWLGFMLVAADRLPRREDLYLVAGAATFGFFMLMVRAHENHSYLALPLLVLAAVHAPARWGLVGLSTAGLLLNLALHDPLLLGAYAATPRPGQPIPLPLLAAYLVNLGLFLLLLGLLGRDVRGLIRGATQLTARSDGRKSVRSAAAVGERAPP